MGFLDNVKSFGISSPPTTTMPVMAPVQELHRWGSIDPTSSTARLADLNNSSSHSLVGSRTASTTNVAGYRPGLRSSSTNLINQGGDVQMQTLNREGLPPLPPVDSLWERIEKWLEEEYPELEDSLNDGASTADLNEFEKDLAIGPLPVEVRQFFKIHDGQFRGGKPTGLIMGLTFLDMESIMEEYAVWAKVAERIEKQVIAINHQKSLPEEASSASFINSETSESNTDNGFLDSAQNDDYMIGDEDEGNGELAFLDRDGGEFGSELRGKLSYIEVLKRRALKRYSVPNADKFQTAFTPHAVRKRPQRPAEGISPSRSGGSTAKLVNIDSSVELPKETLIDDSSKGDETKVTSKDDDSAEGKRDTQKKMSPRIKRN
ncbi:hypothetical protein CJJ09_001879 [Candidozyma auris]|nr:hypothetical protein CJJ09_001879 [[Candida] auris]